MRPLNAVPVTLLVLTAGAALAQPDSVADPNTPLPQPVAAESAPPAIVDDATGAVPVLEDYEASEQISEDLSVAFPVDI